MKLYHISQSYNKGYDTYSDMVVCAESEDDAKSIHPNEQYGYVGDLWKSDSWCRYPDEVTAIYLGEADALLKRGIICASFHAG